MSDLDWPAGFDRTDSTERTRTSKFGVRLAKAFDDLERVLKRLDVDKFRYDFAAPTRQRDGRPYARSDPDDPGFVLRWTMDGDDYAVACDHYTGLRDNVRATGLYLDEKRKMEGRPVETGESEFANARLPPADDDEGGLTPNPAPHEILGVAPDAPEAVVRGAARSLKKDAHPDSGGTTEAFQRIVEAEEAMLNGGEAGE